MNLEWLLRRQKPKPQAVETNSMPLPDPVLEQAAAEMDREAVQKAEEINTLSREIVALCGDYLGKFKRDK